MPTGGLSGADSASASKGSTPPSSPEAAAKAGSYNRADQQAEASANKSDSKSEQQSANGQNGHGVAIDEQGQKLRDFDRVQGRPSFGEKPESRDVSPIANANGTRPTRSAADMRARVETYQQNFDQTLNAEIKDIDKEIVGIDRRLAGGMFGNAEAVTRPAVEARKEKLLQERANLQKLADSPDVDRQSKFEAYQQHFDQVVHDKIADTNQKITDIDRQLGQLKPGGRGEAMRHQGLMSSKEQLLRERADLQKVAETPDAALKALNAQRARESGDWTVSDIGHLALDVIGLAPVVGELADGLNAAWYFKEGRIFEGSMSTAAMAPGLGIGATIAKWGAKAEKTLEGMYNVAPLAKKEIDDLANDIANRHGGTVAEDLLKSKERAIEKSVNIYGGKPQRLTDLARNTIIVPPGNVDAVVAELRAQGAKVKEFTPESNALGYSGFNTVVKTKAGIKAEIQVNTPAMIYAKEPEDIARKILGNETYDNISKELGVPGGQGHAMYEKWRQLDPKSDEAVKIANESQAYYDKFR